VFTGQPRTQGNRATGQPGTGRLIGSGDIDWYHIASGETVSFKVRRVPKNHENYSTTLLIIVRLARWGTDLG